MRVDRKAWWTVGWSVFSAGLLFWCGLSLTECAYPFAVVLAGYSIHAARRALSLRAVARWATAGEWAATDPRDRVWPWQPLHLKGTSRVEYAFARHVDGMLLTVAAVTAAGECGPLAD